MELDDKGKSKRIELIENAIEQGPHLVASYFDVRSPTAGLSFVSS